VAVALFRAGGVAGEGAQDREVVGTGVVAYRL